MIEISFSYGYLYLLWPFMVAWGLLYLFCRRTRREQLLMSLIVLPLGTIGELIYFKDYWIPESVWPLYLGSVPIFVEDFLFSFAIGGIGAVIYEGVFKRRMVKTRIRKHISLTVIVVIFFIISISLYKIGINSIFATSAGLLVAALLMVAQRKDLLLDSLYSGVGVMLIMFTSYSILYNTTSNSGELLQKVWLLYDTKLGRTIFNIPMTEMIWGFTWGMFIGPLYEYWKNYKLVKQG